MNLMILSEINPVFIPTTLLVFQFYPRMSVEFNLNEFIKRESVGLNDATLKGSQLNENNWVSVKDNLMYLYIIR